MIDIKELTRRFGPILAVDRVSFRVERGEVLGFLGPNGAGKSTTMKMVTGFLSPTSGTAVVGGHDVTKEPIKVKEKIGYLPEGAPAYPDMTPEGFLGFVAGVRGLRGAERRSRIDEVVSKVHLEGVLRQSIETLSKGFKRRVGLAAAILHDPEVLIMDEPTDGLDPNQKHEVRELIRGMAPSKATVLSTHILEEVQAVCTRTIIISKGRIVFDGTPGQLGARSRHHNAVSITVRGGSRVKEELERIDGVASVQEVSRDAAPGSSARLAAKPDEPWHPDSRRPDSGVLSCMIFPKGGRSLVDEVARHARGRGWEVDELRVEQGRLDDVFRELTAGAAGGRS